MVLVNNGKIYPFPFYLDSLSGYVKLCNKAKTIISGDSTTYKIKTINQTRRLFFEMRRITRNTRKSIKRNNC